MQAVLPVLIMSAALAGPQTEDPAVPPSDAPDTITATALPTAAPTAAPADAPDSRAMLPVAPSAPTSTPSMSVGAGFGFSSIRGSGLLGGSGAGSLLGLLGGLGTANRQPRLGLLFEYHLSRTLAIGVQAAGGYSEDYTYQGPIGDRQRVTNRSTASAELSLSGRWVSNPGSAVEISPYVAIGTGWSQTVVTTETLKETGDGVDIDETGTVIAVLRGGAGVAFETALTEMLRLRFSALLLDGHYSMPDSAAKSAGRADRIDVQTFGVGVAFEPSIELRMVF